jgi:hypothetical protein
VVRPRAGTEGRSHSEAPLSSPFPPAAFCSCSLALPVCSSSRWFRRPGPPPRPSSSLSRSLRLAQPKPRRLSGPQSLLPHCPTKGQARNQHQQRGGFIHSYAVCVVGCVCVWFPLCGRTMNGARGQAGRNKGKGEGREGSRTGRLTGQQRDRETTHEHTGAGQTEANSAHSYPPHACCGRRDARQVGVQSCPTVHAPAAAPLFRPLRSARTSSRNAGAQPQHRGQRAQAHSKAWARSA